MSWKNPSTSAGFEPVNLGSRGEHVTPRPAKRFLPCFLFSSWSAVQSLPHLQLMDPIWADKWSDSPHRKSPIWCFPWFSSALREIPGYLARNRKGKFLPKKIKRSPDKRHNWTKRAQENTETFRNSQRTFCSIHINQSPCCGSNPATLQAVQKLSQRNSGRKCN